MTLPTPAGAEAGTNNDAPPSLPTDGEPVPSNEARARWINPFTTDNLNATKELILRSIGLTVTLDGTTKIGDIEYPFGGLEEYGLGKFKVRVGDKWVLPTPEELQDQVTAMIEYAVFIDFRNNYVTKPVDAKDMMLNETLLTGLKEFSPALFQLFIHSEDPRHSTSLSLALIYYSKQINQILARGKGLLDDDGNFELILKPRALDTPYSMVLHLSDGTVTGHVLTQGERVLTYPNSIQGALQARIDELIQNRP